MKKISKIITKKQAISSAVLKKQFITRQDNTIFDAKRDNNGIGIKATDLFNLLKNI